LRGYALDSFDETIVVPDAHTDQITCLEGYRENLYSGSRDGIVKVWNTELKCVAQLPYNSAVTAICKLDG